MRMPGIALLRRLAPIKPALSTKHREERLRLLATGLQNFGLALFLGVVVLPAFSASTITPFRIRFLAFVVAGMAESLAFILLRYIPPPPGP